MMPYSPKDSTWRSLYLPFMTTFTTSPASSSFLQPIYPVDQLSEEGQDVTEVKAFPEAWHSGGHTVAAQYVENQQINLIPILSLADPGPL